MPKITPRLLHSAIIALAVTLCGPIAVSQALARPGWAGFGTTAAPWWKRPVVYRADPRGFGGLHGLAGHMDYVHSLGVDALLLTSLGGSDPKQPIDPTLGALEDLEEIVRRGSEYNIRILVELDPHSDLNSAVRMWLVHGVAGFYAPGTTAAQLADIRRAAGSLSGQRIVIGDLSAVDTPTAQRGDAPQLAADGRISTQDKLTAASIRPALEAAQQVADAGRTMPLLFSDAPSLKRTLTRFGDGTHDEAIAKAVAAMLLTTRSATMLYWGQELGLADSTSTITFGEAKKGETPAAGTEAAGNASGSSLLNWYRQLIALGHSNRTIGSGSTTVLNHDDQNVLAWVRRSASPSAATPPIIVVENLSGQPVTLSLKADIQKLHLRGSFLRTVLRTDNAMGAMHLDGMTLQPYQVFIGELRY